jgi:Na+-translocating ferredoxin:NAD+ oxidoreductase RnfG subunit
MTKYVSNIIIAVLLFSLLSNAQEIRDKTEALIKSVYGIHAEFSLTKYPIPKNLKHEIEKKVRQAFFQDYVYIYKVNENGTRVGYAVLDNVIGKSMPITFLVMFDSEGTIISTNIVKYREPYGGGVGSQRWNDQFKGLNSNSNFDVGKNINSISGATISVYSVTKGIQKLALLIEHIKDSR